eukprot:PhF_6_TR27893/c0_g3_i3/m.40873
MVSANSRQVATSTSIQVTVPPTPVANSATATKYVRRSHARVTCKISPATKIVNHNAVLILRASSLRKPALALTTFVPSKTQRHAQPRAANGVLLRKTKTR